MDYLVVLGAGTAVGFLARFLMLKNDYRFYPTYPHGHLTHLSVGFIAAALGGVAVPALFKPDFAAVTFLGLAAQQFRDVRNMERESLQKLDETKLVRRGNDYIEGIAKVFEARNYMTMLTAFLTSLAWQLLGWVAAALVGVVMLGLCLKLMRGKTVRDIAEVVPARLYFDRSLLMVEDVVIMNVGRPQLREKILAEGVGALLKPKDDNGRLTLDSPGQRMAIIHDTSVILGSKIDIGENELRPMIRKNADKGHYGFFLLPNEKDLPFLIDIVNLVPVLESSQSNTLRTKYGRKAAD
jgi:hypothetical protein